MADPTPYDPSYSFTGFQASNPTTPLPADQVDNELENIAESLSETITALADVRRSDGALKNGIVTFDSLSPEVAAQVGEGIEDALVAAEASADASAASATAASASADDAAASADEAEAAADGWKSTSVTSQAVGTGTKTFTTQAGKRWAAGQPVTISSDANPTVNAMYGTVTSYSGTSLEVSVGSFIGSGTLTDWTIQLSGARGATGAQGVPGAGTGDMLAANNLSELTDEAAARGNLGLGTAAIANSTAFATAAQGALADSAVQPEDLPDVVFTDEYISAETAFTETGQFSFTHGLGATPKHVTIELVCKTTDLGYAVDDCIDILTAYDQWPLSSGTFVYGLVIWKNSTTCGLSSWNNTNAGITICNKAGTSYGTITPANWRLVLRAYK